VPSRDLIPARRGGRRRKLYDWFYPNAFDGQPAMITDGKPAMNTDGQEIMLTGNHFIPLDCGEFSETGDLPDSLSITFHDIIGCECIEQASDPIAGNVYYITVNNPNFSITINKNFDDYVDFYRAIRWCNYFTPDMQSYGIGNSFPGTFPCGQELGTAYGWVSAGWDTFTQRLFIYAWVYPDIGQGPPAMGAGQFYNCDNLSANVFPPTGLPSRMLFKGNTPCPISNGVEVENTMTGCVPYPGSDSEGDYDWAYDGAATVTW
jgi:hypothetical protein